MTATMGESSKNHIYVTPCGKVMFQVAFGTHAFAAASLRAVPVFFLVFLRIVYVYVWF